MEHIERSLNVITSHFSALGHTVRTDNMSVDDVCDAVWEHLIQTGALGGDTP
ncbi:MAG TPA: hypothetical protein VIP11_17170 [Gemmatimonadaceae bacterium]